MSNDTLNVATFTYLIRTVIRIQDTTYSLSSLPVNNSINIIPSIKGFLPKENIEYVIQKKKMNTSGSCSIIKKRKDLKLRNGSNSATLMSSRLIQLQVVLSLNRLGLSQFYNHGKNIPESCCSILNEYFIKERE